MKVAIEVWVGICVFATVASSAPLGEDEQTPEYLEFDNRQPYQRGQRLSENYYAISPCAAAAAARSFAPNTLYQNDFGPRYMPSAYDYGNQNYGGNVYRADDPYNNNEEALSFSDMNFIEDVPTGRSNYRIAPSSVLLKGANFANIKNQLVHQVAPAVYGVYPNGNAGGCNVPLFFSCTPQVVSGRVARSEPQIYNTPFNTHSEDYRGVPDRHVLQGNHVEQAVHDHITPVESDVQKIKENPM